MTMTRSTLFVIAFGLLAGQAGAAALQSQYGILDLTANGGINPNTGVAWAAGDTYRLAFFTSDALPAGVAQSNDPTTYNDFVTAQAHQNTALLGSSWNAIVSVNLDSSMTQADSPKRTARENTGTTDLTGGAGIGGAGSPVFAMNGTTAIARNNADIWNGWSNPFDGDTTLRIFTNDGNSNNDVHYSPFLDQFGGGDTGAIHGRDVWTGSNSDGSARTPLGITTDSTSGNWGSSNANRSGRVYLRFDSGNLVTTSTLRMYALSEVLTVTVVPEPSSLALLGIGTLLIARRRRG